MIQCIVLLMVVFNMYCDCVVCNQLNLVSPSSGVASLRPRMGGEPPWLAIFISHMQVLIDSLGNLKFLESFHIHK